MSNLKTEVISILQKLLGNFITAILLALTALPEGTITNPSFWTSAVVLNMLGVALQTATKQTWKSTLPESIGGNPKK